MLLVKTTCTFIRDMLPHDEKNDINIKNFNGIHDRKLFIGLHRKAEIISHLKVPYILLLHKSHKQHLKPNK